MRTFSLRNLGEAHSTRPLFLHRMLLRSSRLWLRSAKPSPPQSFSRLPLNLLSRPTRTSTLCSHSGPLLSRHYSSSRYNLTMSPVANGIGEKYGNFDLVTRAKLGYADILVSKWKSRVTGLSVVHLDYTGMFKTHWLLWAVGN